VVSLLCAPLMAAMYFGVVTSIGPVLAAMIIGIGEVSPRSSPHLLASRPCTSHPPRGLLSVLAGGVHWFTHGEEELPSLDMGTGLALGPDVFSLAGFFMGVVWIDMLASEVGEFEIYLDDTITLPRLRNLCFTLMGHTPSLFRLWGSCLFWPTWHLYPPRWWASRCWPGGGLWETSLGMRPWPGTVTRAQR